MHDVLNFAFLYLNSLKNRRTRKTFHYPLEDNVLLYISVTLMFITNIYLFVRIYGGTIFYSELRSVYNEDLRYSQLVAHYVVLTNLRYKHYNQVS